jgi:hypothetical protein
MLNKDYLNTLGTVRISDISEVYFNMSSKSLTIPAKRLTGFLIKTPTGPTYISDWECCAVKAMIRSLFQIRGAPPCLPLYSGLNVGGLFSCLDSEPCHETWP